MSPRPRVLASPRQASLASRPASPRPRVSASPRLYSPARRGFTLIELLVVAAIIVLLIGIAVPVLGPAMNTGQQSQLVQQLTGAITVAQARAVNLGGYAIRIERAFKTNNLGFMVDANGQSSLMYDINGNLVNNTAFSPALAPVWLDYQQIRYLKPSKVNACYEPTIDDVIKLPPNAWLAPDYALFYDGSTAQRSPDIRPYFNSTVVWPTTGNNCNKFNPFETFCIVFDQRGQVVELRTVAVAFSDKYQYQNQTLPSIVGGGYVYPMMAYPYNSARGVILYDRKQFDSFGGNLIVKANYLATKGRPLFVNRFIGSLVEGRAQ